MKIIDKHLPEDDAIRKLVAVSLTTVLAGFLTILGIYGLEQYGIALFILTPVFIGSCSTILYGRKRQISWKDALSIGTLTLFIYVMGLLIFAIEGLICIAMLAPLGFLLTLLGSLIGYAVSNKTPKNAAPILLLMVGLIPAVAFVEKDIKPDLTAVVTSVEINADAQTVWKNLVAFPRLDEPDEWLFKAGIAYPISADIVGTGKGAKRYCNFTTGCFVEPITIWDEPQLLQFSVEEQPAPMKELSFWDVDAPHLHDYFVSKQGQFKLKKLSNGNTLLEGTTWYYHNIRPAIYWRPWSNFIIHMIHNRVLTHIKKISENS